MHPGNSLGPVVGSIRISTQSSEHLLLGLWLVGTCALLLRLMIGHLRLLRQARRPSARMRALLASQLDTATLNRIRTHAMGPAVLFAWPCMILIPTDFAPRFNPQQRALVLAHEQTHLRRADPLWRLLAELARAALWFHPLVWLALPRFRLDQELACDAATLSGNHRSRLDYARTLMGDLSTPRTPLLTSWINPRQLKERLIMIKSGHVHSRRRHFGYGLIMADIAATTLLVGAALSTPELAHAETAQGSPPVISVNINQHGTYWNGNKVDSLSLQHRSVVAARINPEIPVLLTAGTKVPDDQASDMASTLRQSGLKDVDIRRINTTALAEISPDEDSLMQYRAQRGPRYPASTVHDKQQGTVVVHVHFAADGTALGAVAQPTEASTELIKASLSAILSWRTEAGENLWKRIPVQYELRGLDKLPDLQASQDGEKAQMAAGGDRIGAAPGDSMIN